MTDVETRSGSLRPLLGGRSPQSTSEHPLAWARPLALDAVAAAAVDSGLRRVELVAWRDIDDPEAGGSELHAHEIASRWGAEGLDVVLRTSAVRGAPARVERPGYRALRRSGRYGVFPACAAEMALGLRGRPDGLVEIWNGMPFFSPLWRRGPRLVFLHHVHAEMWRMVLPRTLARVGEVMERRLAPPLYRNTRVVTLSESSRQEIQSVLGLPRVDVVPPGVDPRFTPGPGRSPTPLVLAVGRLVPVKRLGELVEVLAAVRSRVPALRAVIAGEGYGRPEVESAISRLGAEEWIELPGRCSGEELLSLYRQAWVLASSSQREGWGMTITEAAACATPAVVSDIPGHRDAVADGASGLLASGAAQMIEALSSVMSDRVLRQRLGRGALARAGQLGWDATAAGTLRALLAEHRTGLDGARPVPVVAGARAARPPRRRLRDHQAERQPSEDGSRLEV